MTRPSGIRRWATSRGLTACLTVTVAATVGLPAISGADTSIPQEVTAILASPSLQTFVSQIPIGASGTTLEDDFVALLLNQEASDPGLVPLLSQVQSAENDGSLLAALQAGTLGQDQVADLTWIQMAASVTPTMQVNSDVCGQTPVGPICSGYVFILTDEEVQWINAMAAVIVPIGDDEIMAAYSFAQFVAGTGGQAIYCALTLAFGYVCL